MSANLGVAVLPVETGVQPQIRVNNYFLSLANTS